MDKKNCSARIPKPALGLLLLVFAGSSSGSAESPFIVERGVRQLFLDDGGIASMEGLRLAVHPPKRHPKNPLIKPDTAWESVCSVYGTAYFDEAAGLFKLWYLTTPRDRGLKPLASRGRERPPHTTLLAYAESKDGIEWAKPRLGLFPYDGDSQNNLLDLGRDNCEGISVLHEPRDPDPQRRWKAVYWDHGSGGWEVRNGKPYSKDGPDDGFCVAFSADGLRWAPYEGNPVLRRYCDTNQNVVYDPKLKKYVAFSRFGFGRKLARSDSADFLHWSEPQIVLQCDEKDGPQTQIYGAGVDLYEGVYLAMIWIYRQGGDGKIDTQLASSRDGLHWTRAGERAAWLPLGDDASWEGGMVRSVERLIRRGEELYIYYGGVHGPHTGPKFPKVERQHPGSIGLAILRRDGFVSLEAGPAGGHFISPPFPLPEGALHLNAEAPSGEIIAALLDGEGKEISGLERSRPVRADSTDATVSWEKPIPAERRGQPARLKVEIKSARLYSYWWD